MLLGNPDFSVTPTQLSPAPDDLLACFDQGRVLSAWPNGALPTLAQAAPLLPPGFAPFELGRAGTRGLYAPDPYTGVKIEEGRGLRYQTVQIFREMSCDDAALLTSAWHLWTWYDHHRFCGVCASPLRPCATERALVCPACSNLVFPAIAPAVIVAVTHGDRILLAKSARSPAARYALISGYVEVGETLEHAVRREVAEEVGLKLGAVRYLGDQPWGISGSHMFAFHAQAQSDGPIVCQASEIAHAHWVARDALQPGAPSMSIAFALMERFRQGTL